MADDPEPPRRFFELKPRSFERVNPLAAASDPTAAPAARIEPASSVPAADPSRPITLQDLHAAAAVPGPVLRRTETTRPNEVHGILRDNLAREQAAGLHQVADRPRRKSRRARDYFLLVGSSNLGFGLLALGGFRSGNAILFVSALAAIGLITAGATWVMWFVMDDY